MICLLCVALHQAVSEPPPVRNVDIGKFIKLSRDDFRALDPSGYNATLLSTSTAATAIADPLGITLARLCFEILSSPGSWKSAAESKPEIFIRGSPQDFHPVEYGGDFSDIVSAFYSFDGDELLIFPFHVQRDSPSAVMLSQISGSIMDLEKMATAMASQFQQSLLGRSLTDKDLLPATPVRISASPPQSFNLSTNLEWNKKSNFQEESKKFSSALGRFVASVSLSVLSAGTYFLYSEAYSRSAAEIATVYISGGAAIAFISASAAFAVESVIRLSRLLRYSH